jgi:tRNA pseudouridine38-40 synthase
MGQVAHFDLDGAPDPKTVRDALNDHLRRGSDGPRHITVLTAFEVLAEFDARFSAIARRYEFHIVNRVAAPALDRDRAWHVLPNLDPAAMQSAADVLVGKHDFTTFRSVHCQAKSPVKTLDTLIVQGSPEKVLITAQARSFLHNQVRAIAGTLVKVGEGKWTAIDVKQALESRDRARCGPTAPPHGLVLARVFYPGEDGA